MPETAPALVFRTEQQRPGGGWVPGSRLTVGFEPGKAVSLAQLGWRDRDGNESTVGFDPAMTTFTGVRTGPDGTSYAWKGCLEKRLTARPVHRFRSGRAEEPQEDLKLLIEDGGAPVARVDWTDREGGGGVIVLRSIDLDRVGEANEVSEVKAGNEHFSAGEVAENLLDEDSTKWLSWRRADRVEFTMARPVRVRHYTLVSANDFADRDPRDWVLKGSVDRRRWDVLDTRSDEFFPRRHFARDFQVTGPAADTPYRYLRLEITRNCGASELQLESVRFSSAERTYESFAGHRYEAGKAPMPYTGTAGEAAVGIPRTAEDWRSYLAGYSADMLRVMDEEEILALLDEKEDSTGAGEHPTPWLGFDGATEEQIEALEERLGTRLPPSYRSFLAASDGWNVMGAFVYSLHGTSSVGWMRDLGSDWGLGEHHLKKEGMVGPTLLVSDETDAQYWLLDAGDVSPDGEWAAYIWASWYPGLGERHGSFAELVAAERASFEELSRDEGRPVRPEAADDLLAQGRRAALEGQAHEALDVFRRAEEKGSGAAAYLKVVLSAFLDLRGVHHKLRDLLRRPHVVAEIGTEQIRAEAVPLLLRSAGLDTFADAARELRLLDEALPGLGLPSDDQEWTAWLAERRTPEPPAFERALATARELAAHGADDDAWNVLEEALAEWCPLSPHRIAPVVLLTDPALRGAVTPRRAREAVFTPRGASSRP
ncbi:SMI1/KNR4 family protein [Nocardiopsis algeriensis]|uniref:SMI1/KNR4 family protein n=1 Tax=Nocardiopsis algeriensis TaxID=1478215 RepID=UPI003B43C0DA